MKKILFAIVLSACCAYGEDLVVEKGSTVEITATATYDTVTVHGTVNIADGASLTATTLALGPSAGDAAVINILGKASKSLVATVATVGGADGGTGCVIAPCEGAWDNQGYNNNCVIVFGTLTVADGATVGEDGYIDIVKIGAGTVDLKTFTNKSASFARLLVCDGRVGHSQYYDVDRFIGKFRIEAYGNGSIYMGGGYTACTYNIGELIFDANGKDVNFCDHSDGDSQVRLLKAGVGWEEVRNVRFIDRARIALGANADLPYGPDTGELILNADSSFLSIGTGTVHLNGIKMMVASDKNCLRGSAGGTVIFGAGNADGSIRGRIAPDLAVEKEGTGTTEVIGDSAMGALHVKEGVFKVRSPLTLSSLVVDAGATLEIDGVELAPTSGQAAVEGSLVLKNGGKLRSSVNTECNVRLKAGCSGDFTKRGCGWCILENPVAFSTNVHVQAGGLSFSAAGYDTKLLRWNVTAWNNKGWYDTANGATADAFYLGEWGLADEDGNRVGRGSGSAAIGTSPADMAPGTAAFAAGTVMMAGVSGNANSLFDASQWPRCRVESPKISDAGGVTVYVKLKDSDKAVCAMNFAAAYGGWPRTWTVDGSRDNGETWERLVTVENDDGVDKAEFWQGSDVRLESTTVPSRFSFNSPDVAYARAGVKDMPATMAIEVDDGATLDFSNVTGGQQVDAITVDMSGAGTVRNLVFADAGELRVVAEQGVRVDGMSLPLAVIDAEGVANLATWDLVVNGETLKNWKIKLRNEHLLVQRTGLVIIFH